MTCFIENSNTLLLLDNYSYKMTIFYTSQAG